MLNETELDFFKAHIPFWDKLTTNQQNMLTTTSKAVHFKKAQTIHHGENECIGMLLIKEGTIRIYITSEEGREVTLYRLEANDICILSASCVLQSITFDVSVEAETDCEVLQIAAPTFARLSSENINVELFSYKLATERFSDVMWAMQQILFTSFDKRLAAFLLDESLKLNSLNINLTHEQIAKYLGSAREVVSRMLKYFSKEGYISLSRGTITILDKDALRALTI